MRRILALVLLGLAGFLLAMSALVKFYAYPKLAVVPIDQSSTSYSVGEDMTYFSIAERKEVVDTLTTKIRIIGDVAASEEAGDNTTVWEKSTITTNSAGDEIAVSTERFAIDRTTAEAVDCCNTNVDGTPVTYKGLVTKFPMNTQKTDYEYWDGDLQDTGTFKYSGEEDIEGLKTYVFKMHVEPTHIGDREIPSSILGEKPGEMLQAEEWYSNDRTYWVEPETGAMVKVEEKPNTVFRYDGTDRVKATVGTSGFPESQIQNNIEEYKGLSTQLNAVRVLVPIGGLILGLVFGVLGALLLRGSGLSKSSADKGPATA